METDHIPVATDACPCGAGQVRVDVTLRYNGWSTDSSWEGTITCGVCNALYTVIQFGRGAALVRTEEVERQEKLHGDAVASERAFLAAAEVVAVLDAIADELEALPTAAAKYRLACQLGLESATLPTFRKHIRGTPMRRWLESNLPTCFDTDRTLARLVPLFGHLGRDTGEIEGCIARASSLRDQAAYMPEVVMSLGPVSVFAAMSEAGKMAAAARTRNDGALP